MLKWWLLGKNYKNNIYFIIKLEEIDRSELKDFKKAFNKVIKDNISSIEKIIENGKENFKMINISPIIPPSKEKAEYLFKVLSSIQT